MLEDAGVETPAAQREGPVVRPLRVREMQTKLHRWAVADDGFRFDDVYNFVCDPATLVVAFERVAGNAGARTPGVDGTRADHVRAFGAEAYLANIRALLKACAYRPLPVRERMIPKPGSRKRRRLGIPTVTA
jgi:RNA-directed DNA polymerase